MDGNFLRASPSANFKTESSEAGVSLGQSLPGDVFLTEDSRTSRSFDQVIEQRELQRQFTLVQEQKVKFE